MQPFLLPASPALPPLLHPPLPHLLPTHPSPMPPHLPPPLPCAHSPTLPRLPHYLPAHAPPHHIPRCRHNTSPSAPHAVPHLHPLPTCLHHYNTLASTAHHRLHLYLLPPLPLAVRCGAPHHTCPHFTHLALRLLPHRPLAPTHAPPPAGTATCSPPCTYTAPTPPPPPPHAPWHFLQHSPMMATCLYALSPSLPPMTTSSCHAILPMPNRPRAAWPHHLQCSYLPATPAPAPTATTLSPLCLPRQAMRRPPQPPLTQPSLALGSAAATWPLLLAYLPPFFPTGLHDILTFHSGCRTCCCSATPATATGEVLAAAPFITHRRRLTLGLLTALQNTTDTTTACRAPPLPPCRPGGPDLYPARHH